MVKKILSGLLVVAMSLFSIGVFAKNESNASKAPGKNKTVQTKQLTVTEDKGEGTIENSDIDEDADEDEDSEDEDADEDKDDEDSEDEDADEDKDDEDKDDEDEEEIDQKDEKGKSKVAKDELAAKKQERTNARIEAKEYIKGIKKLFKDADVETKKEILAEIAAVKKELKDYSIGIFVRGLVVDFDKYDGVEPVIEEGRTLVPLRAITETLGANVEWVEETNTIIITKEETTIIMQLDNKIAYVNGEEVELDVAPTTIKDRTLVPIRFVSETFNLTVDWDDDSQTVIAE